MEEKGSIIGCTIIPSSGFWVAFRWLRSFLSLMIYTLATSRCYSVVSSVMSSGVGEDIR